MIFEFQGRFFNSDFHGSHIDHLIEDDLIEKGRTVRTIKRGLSAANRIRARRILFELENITDIIPIES